MNSTGALEVNLALMQPGDLWRQSGRLERYQRDGIIFGGKDRKGNDLYLAPTAEEVVTAWAAADLRSHKQMPLSLWQMDWKFRDELRPRMGLMRGRLFRMKDAYSFDADEEGMQRSYEKQRQAYTRIFTRMGFRFIGVQADSGAIGGKGSAEFMALTNFGEDLLLTCNRCDYGANVEKAESKLTPHEYSPELRPLQKAHTPNVRTIADLESFLSVSARDMVKTLIYVADQVPVAVCCRGDLEINEVKLKNVLGASELEIASEAVVTATTGAPVGFAGPVGLPSSLKIVFDESVRPMRSFLCGANEADQHFMDVHFGRDLPAPESFPDVHSAQAGDLCSQCPEGTLTESRGIEIGHVFMLQQSYAEKLGVAFQGADTKPRTPWMGCYGIGTTRCLQAMAEQQCDEKGLVWPEAIAPYRYAIIPASYKEGSAARTAADALFELLTQRGEEVLLDDRDGSFGAKMADAELLGFPKIIVVGRKAAEGIVEVVDRKSGERSERLIDSI
jgi:prolyl-tRNA synthetase